MGALSERFRKHTSNVSLWTQPPLMLVQPCLRGRECNLTVAVPQGVYPSHPCLQWELSKLSGLSPLQKLG